MNALILAIMSLGGFLLAYKFYATFLSEKIFALNPGARTPAHEFEDGVDHVPTLKSILFGHHFASIAGAAPIVGPAIGVIWGWLPAFLWVVFGTIFLGAVHDFGALVVSLRHQGKSIGELTENIIGTRARNLFLLIMFFLLLVVIAVFALVIALMFNWYPQTVFPVACEMIIAVVVGYMVYRMKTGILIPTIIAVIVMYATIYIGTLYPIELGDTFLGSGLTTWIYIILLYSFIAAVLPVWLLLQPRDHINAHELFIGMALMYLGLLIIRPDVVAPAVQLHPEGAPPIYPFLFVTIACGAISGFHSLVSSGTTVKQLDNEAHAKMIGYGGMLAEGTLSTMAIIACTAGFATATLWNEHYANWGAAAGLGTKLSAFVDGAGNFVAACGIPLEFAIAIVGVVVVSFALTTIDTATRLQRYVIGEIGSNYNITILRNRYVGGAIAILTALVLALAKDAGKGGMILWPVFGTTNQLLAALALLMITMYLMQTKKPVIYTLIPMIFMMITAMAAMVLNIQTYYNAGNWMLTGIGIAIFVLALWLLFEAWDAYRKRDVHR
ncbi:MAG: carbon starvation protein A [Candidatus Methanogaster sp.]|uniref:Carbon starvation protein A n=1 Tax=Candidatus Methanogaster sp. TaxID=3386292 RepID=A0AC61L591_9EURY|nr:MAG: carbon starvation protein A [ANME-2 cluster archaeon]